MSRDDQRIRTFARDGLRFEVDDAGPLGGDVVVLLHGFPTDRSSWRAVTPLLHEAGLRTLAPDQRGYSPGARPTGVDAYRLEELVADVLGLVDASGRERVHLVGHDWGGGIAWLLAGNHAGRVASLTALSTPHPAALGRAWRRGWDQRRRSWYVAAFQVPALPEQVMARRFEALMRRGGLPEEDRRRYADRLATPAAISGPINWYRASRRSSVPAHRVHVPTTYVWGCEDPFLGPDAARLTAEHVEAPYELVELDAGHWLPEMRAAECAAAVLRSVARGSAA
ncbi:alpha/beta fold hydrolase [Intrasporangium flavum]|uniref:alpha/beta fold hydrolase n=1 Tax=Intrasporangium flavum TaxID=1428657 RepID=UPI00096D31F2|nr:alpha/beta hydrolase [Intrasporangium flavum]